MYPENRTAYNHRTKRSDLFASLRDSGFTPELIPYILEGLESVVGKPGDADIRTHDYRITALEVAIAGGTAVGEPALGNPASDGYILSSTAAGVRSWIPNSAAVAWGSITGTLSAQTDLQAALDGKVDNSDIIDSAHGGTGQSAYAPGDMLYWATGTALSKLAAVAQGSVLRSGATPSWGKVQLSGGVIDVSGTLGADYGGTGLASYTIGDILYASGATTLSKLADVTTGSYLASGGVGVAPAWATLNQAAVAGLTTGDSPTFAGATLSGMTAGSVLFAGASGVISQDNANLFWDNTSNRLGIGTPSPVAVLHVATTNSNTFILDKGGAMGSLQGSFTSFSYGGLILGVSTASQYLALSIAGQRTATPGAPIGRIGFHSWNTNNNLNTTIGAEFKATSEDGTTTNYGLNLAVLTRTGTGAMTERQRWSADGNIGFAGQTSFGTSAVGVGAWKNGTAPSTSPADAVQIWSADRGATAGKAGLHIRSEDGTSHVFGDRVGIGTLSPVEVCEVAGGNFLVSNGYIVDDDVLRPFIAVSGTNSNRVITVTINKFDNAASLNTRMKLHWWVSTSSYGTPTVLGGTQTAAQAPTPNLDTVSAATLNAMHHSFTGATRVWTLTITNGHSLTAVTYYFHVEIQGIYYTSTFILNTTGIT